MKRIHFIILLILVVAVSGCINSGNGSINQLVPEINDHIKKGDSYFNESAIAANSFKLDEALSKCELAASEYRSARDLASEALGYARNGADPIIVNYLEILVSELDAKINATIELKNAIQMLSINETENGNSNIEMANSYMRTAKELESERMEIVKKNPEKFS
ncbi:hypothetical protein [Methanothermobacter thermautotrophicus]|uniref:hypothetical protein n=1 Tax=Methanothermobacter thermautotrophicus TaxID=145262 RepID=UPI0022B97795|nr:hypothetical protein [Methanothermobacter thermautotrophicus]WBF08784.1 hypothetical protein ISG36_03610 [Methanothermobacter thermautotrophicus]